MDRVVRKKKWTVKRITLMVSIPILFGLLIIMAFSSNSSTYKVNRARIAVHSVVYGEFQDVIAIQGSVEPLSSIQIDATEGGVVEGIFVEDGQMVEMGTPLMRLSNTSLTLDFMNRETQIVEQINNLRSTRISLDQNKRQVQEQLLDIDYQLKEQRRQWHIDSMLFKDSVLSQTDFLATKANYEYLRKRKALLTERFRTDEKYRESQMHRIDASVDMMERNLEAIRGNLENLIVKAPISGQLNSFDHEIGQTKNRGERLGRVDVPDQYLVSAMVDQYYINRLTLGQFANMEIGKQNFVLEVTKVFPTITNNQFEVHLHFTQDVPGNIRRGQNVQLRLELSAKKKALMVARGAFYQSSGGKYVYVLDSKDRASKRKVTLGTQNPDFIEVIQGLSEGEEVITSSYNGFGDVDQLILTQ